MNYNNVEPDVVGSIQLDDACTNMLYTISPPTPDELEKIRACELFFNPNYVSIHPVVHDFYQLPSRRPPRVPLDIFGFSAWDRVLIRHRGCPDRTGVLVGQSSTPNGGSTNYWRVHYDSSRTNANHPVVWESTSFILIPWPQHEGRVYKDCW